jgi:hypothetical protein
LEIGLNKSYINNDKDFEIYGKISTSTNFDDEHSLNAEIGFKKRF